MKIPYPLHLDLTGKRVLVVGAGPVGLRRARSAAEAGADVEVVALQAPEEIVATRRAFTATDVDGAWLVLACTGVVDDLVAEVCAAKQVWCVRADDATLSDAWTPAVGRVEDVVVSVTAGRDPRRAMAIRDFVVESDLPLDRQR